MLERCAKALHDEMARMAPTGPKKYWETSPQPVKDHCRHMARVMFEAAMEPTEAMTVAADSVMPDDIFASEKASRLRYQAMIKNILGEDTLELTLDMEAKP